MSPDLEKDVGKLEGQLQALQKSHDEQRGIIWEIHEKVNSMPAEIHKKLNEDVQKKIESDLSKAIRWCRKHPPKRKAKPNEGKPQESESKEEKTVSSLWNKAMVTALITIIGIVVAWAQNVSGGVKNAPDKPAITQDK